ncbi:hypothetical protein [Flavobacterium aquidurense]|uniref:Uncharacterized protein n=1 Tax=Flavobacterium aquidurense TaxID=362413 RepID=A0A0Q0WA02_9FLAO|nr:hypothetical protein [Flavobacterium aquidurense]KQB41158.1 hypothetical protein RC62_4534 [Flavobacterium aquidurense]
MNKSKQKDENKQNDYIEKDILINVYFKEILKSDEQRNKYLDLLNQRIDENKKSLNSLLMIMIFLVIAFPLILDTKISEISVGPFKLQENSIALYIIPSIFAFCHYKVIQVNLNLNMQSKYYKGLTSVIFNHSQYSTANIIITPYLFLESTQYYHFTEKSRVLKLLLTISWFLLRFGIFIFPYWFTYFTTKILFNKYGLNNTQEIMFFSSPIIITVFAIILHIQYFKREGIPEEKEENAQ